MICCIVCIVICFNLHCDLVSEALCWPMLLSTFSHYSLFHMAANMYVLWSFSSSIVNMMGKEQFMALYLSAGVWEEVIIWYPDKRKSSSFLFSINIINLCVIVLFSGVISTFVSYVCKTATGRLGPSLGAVSVFLNDFQAFSICIIVVN